MSLKQGSTTEYECDGCGTDLGNGGVTVCSILSLMDPDNEGAILNLHYCYSREETKGKQTQQVKGCTDKIWSKTVTRHLRERRAESTA
jgi:hypothetical protein